MSHRRHPFFAGIVFGGKSGIVFLAGRDVTAEGGGGCVWVSGRNQLHSLTFPLDFMLSTSPPCCSLHDYTAVSLRGCV